MARILSGDEDCAVFFLAGPLGEDRESRAHSESLFSVEVRVNSDEKRTASENKENSIGQFGNPTKNAMCQEKTQNPTEKLGVRELPPNKI